MENNKCIFLKFPILFSVELRYITAEFRYITTNAFFWNFRFCSLLSYHHVDHEHYSSSSDCLHVWPTLGPIFSFRSDDRDLATRNRMTTMTMSVTDDRLVGPTGEVNHMEIPQALFVCVCVYVCEECGACVSASRVRCTAATPRIERISRKTGKKDRKA